MIEVPKLTPNTATKRANELIDKQSPFKSIAVTSQINLKTVSLFLF